ncbi:mRNA cleavage and polyadenylation factor I II subunit pfc 11 [Tubulinosema ratisbonensis]|uniref:mRNA cleavage and polyadenylation factor I II subunit pfc 11 n=1 Tax=Tubulinosema ratisbonensis TaxID=291195 RepID=A0A437AND0_9MICR|nr:mRNA cleavage and polyadenylation factor I II subunit pfc 11 [Tubulinosema ratisbonensis]
MCKEFINLLSTYKKGENIKLNVILIIFNTKKYLSDELIKILELQSKFNNDLEEVICELKKNTYFKEKINNKTKEEIIVKERSIKIPGLNVSEEEVKKVKLSDLENELKCELNKKSEINEKNKLNKINETNESNEKNKTDEINEKNKIDKLNKKIIKNKLTNQSKKKNQNSKKLLKKLIKILYKPIQCKICALRFDTHESEALSVHLQDHQRKIRSTEQQTTLSREYACKESEWLVSKISLPNLVFSNVKVKSDKAQECKICKEKIQLKFDDEEEAWVLHEGVKTEDGFFYHRKCIE